MCCPLLAASGCPKTFPIFLSEKSDFMKYPGQI